LRAGFASAPDGPDGVDAAGKPGPAEGTEDEGKRLLPYIAKRLADIDGFSKGKLCLVCVGLKTCAQTWSTDSKLCSELLKQFT
jgi:hypothetical protein